MGSLPRRSQPLDLLKEFNIRERFQMEKEVRAIINEMFDNYIDIVLANSCKRARRRQANALEVQDLKLSLDDDSYIE